MQLSGFAAQVVPSAATLHIVLYPAHLQGHTLFIAGCIADCGVVLLVVPGDAQTLVMLGDVARCGVTMIVLVQQSIEKESLCLGCRFVQQ